MSVFDSIDLRPKISPTSDGYSGRLVIFVFVVIATLMFAGKAQAEGVYVAGEGLVECGEYIQNRKESSQEQSYIYVTWFRGYASGYNMATSGKSVQKIPARDSILLYLDNYCQANPLDLLVTAAGSMIHQLGGTRK